MSLKGSKLNWVLNRFFYLKNAKKIRGSDFITPICHKLNDHTPSVFLFAGPRKLSASQVISCSPPLGIERTNQTLMPISMALASTCTGVTATASTMGVCTRSLDLFVVICLWSACALLFKVCKSSLTKVILPLSKSLHKLQREVGQTRDSFRQWTFTGTTIARFSLIILSFCEDADSGSFWEWTPARFPTGYRLK